MAHCFVEQFGLFGIRFSLGKLLVANPNPTSGNASGSSIGQGRIDDLLEGVCGQTISLGVCVEIEAHKLLFDPTPANRCGW
jgi:hypothetical protein